MNAGRWDPVVHLLHGPLAARGEIVLIGPVVRIGADPGPGGLELRGYRGLDDRQAVISVYDGRAEIAPVGTAQVRVAPHEHVDWEEVLPLREPATLADGDVIHLGPLNRGARLRYVTSRPVDVWVREEAAAVAEDDEEEAAPAPAVEVVETGGGVPGWFIGGLVVIAMATVAATVALVVVPRLRSPEPIGPRVEGLEIYEEDLDLDEAIDPRLAEGFNQAWDAFVARWNAAASGRPEDRDPSHWDAILLDRTTRAANRQLQAWAFWARLEAVRDAYAEVVERVRAAGLPDVLAAIPYKESLYRPDAFNATDCGFGPWQFMPEVALQAGLRVADCPRRGRSPWSPTRKAPIPTSRAPYIEAGRCLIPPSGCGVDERGDFERSTEGAIRLLKRAWEDPDLAASGALVQLVITSHNAGYDHSPYRPNGARWSTEVRHAYRGWLAATGRPRDPAFLGQQIRDSLRTPCSEKTTWLCPVSQHYAYNVIAIHALAACYYGQNHPDEPAFGEWERFTRGGGYCTRLEIPTPAQVAARRR